jgi:hypothetical protein
MKVYAAKAVTCSASRLWPHASGRKSLSLPHLMSSDSNNILDREEKRLDVNKCLVGIDAILKRMFDPKDSAYRAFADSFLGVIASKRDKAINHPVPTPKIKALSIMLERYWTEAPANLHQWVFNFYETDFDNSAVCSRNGE